MQSVTLAAGASTVLMFTWNTQAASPGTHVLAATASPVLGETDTADNALSRSSLVVEPLIHDVAVSSLIVPASVTKGTSVVLSVGVVNQDTADETFIVSVTDTPPAGGMAGTLTAPQSVTLAAGAGATLPFTWNTQAATGGTHVIRANASEVAGETDTADNTLARSSIVILQGPPMVSAITPPSIRGGTTIVVTVSGQAFVPGARLTFANGSGNLPTASGVIVATIGLSLTASVTVRSGGPNKTRRWDVVVTNPDGQSARLAAAFSVIR